MFRLYSYMCIRILSVRALRLAGEYIRVFGIFVGGRLSYGIFG